MEDSVQYQVLHIQIFLSENRQFCLLRREGGYGVSIEELIFKKLWRNLLGNRNGKIKNK